MRSVKRTWAVVAVVASVGVLLWLGAFSAQAAGDTSWARLMPSDASAVAGADMQGFLASPLYRRFEDELLKHGKQPFEEMVAEVGLDPRRDIDRIVIATDAGSVEAWTTGIRSSLAYAEGRFPTDRIHQILESKGAEAMNHRGVEMLVFPMNSRNEDKKLAVAFLDNQRALMGGVDGVAAAIDRDAAGGPSMADNVDLLERAAGAVSRGQFWSVSLKSGELIQKFDAQGLPPEHARILAVLTGMTETTATVDLANGLDAQFDGICGSAEDARTLADAARGIVAMGRLSLKPGQEVFLKLLDSVDIADSGEEIRVSLELDSFELDRIIDAFEKQTGRKAAAD